MSDEDNEALNNPIEEARKRAITNHESKDEEETWSGEMRERKDPKDPFASLLQQEPIPLSKDEVHELNRQATKNLIQEPISYGYRYFHSTPPEVRGVRDEGEPAQSYDIEELKKVMLDSVYPYATPLSSVDRAPKTETDDELRERVRQRNVSNRQVTIQALKLILEEKLGDSFLSVVEGPSGYIRVHVNKTPKGFQMDWFQENAVPMGVRILWVDESAPPKPKPEPKKPAILDNFVVASLGSTLFTLGIFVTHPGNFLASLLAIQLCLLSYQVFLNIRNRNRKP